MNKEKMSYMKTEIKNYNKIVRAELLFTPLLIALPLIIGVFLIYDWYIRGFSANNAAYTGQLMLGVIISHYLSRYFYSLKVKNRVLFNKF